VLKKSGGATYQKTPYPERNIRSKLKNHIRANFRGVTGKRLTPVWGVVEKGWKKEKEA